MSRKLTFPLLLIIGCLTFMSCSNSSKKINQEVKEETATEKKANTEINLADKIIKRFERQGIEFSSDQLIQINKIVSDMGSMENPTEDRGQLRSQIKTNIEQNVLTEGQREMVKKRGKK